MCDDYGLYRPKDIRILSPRQIENKIQKKLKKKTKKQSTASKRGKSNRRNGRQAERDLVKWLNKEGIEANLVPMSGALKDTNVIRALANDEMIAKMKGDVKIKIGGNVYTTESKRDIHTDSLYKKAEVGILHIKGFAYLVRQDLFLALVNGAELPVDKVVEDKGYKKIHGYFNQDNSDIVVISRPYCDRLFFIKENIYDEIKTI